MSYTLAELVAVQNETEIYRGVHSDPQQAYFDLNNRVAVDLNAGPVSVVWRMVELEEVQ